MAQFVAVVFAVACTFLTGVARAGDLKLDLPPVKTSLDIQGQPVPITAWGAVSSTGAGVFRLSMVVDLTGFQENLTPLLSAQLNRSDRCGERISVERAVLNPVPPGGLLNANVHYERFTCVKALGKEIVKRLVGGNAMVEVNLTPGIEANRPKLTAQVARIDADGSLGEVLNSGSFGDSLRQKVTASIESAVQKAANLKSALPADIENTAALQTVQFADGGAGRLRLNLTGEVRLTNDQFRDLAKGLPQ